MMEFQVRVDGQGPFRADLEVSTEVIDVSTLGSKQTPDPAWEFVDAAGHYHSWTKAGELPTLRRHVIAYAMTSEDETWDTEEVLYTCSICGHPASPEYVTTGPSPHKEVMQGRSSWEAIVYGVHLEIGSQVSVSFSTPVQGKVRYFGIGQVVSHNISMEAGGATYSTKIGGHGNLGHKF